MFRMMTQEEIDTSKRNVERIGRMRGLESKVTSLLMDVNVGSQGLYENMAREKAKAIVKLIKKLGYKK